MKIKNDFVTNSSSASYILTLQTKDNMSISEFNIRFNEFIDEIKRFNEREFTNIRFLDGSDISAIDDNIFKIESWTSMHNGQFDIPGFMRYIIVEDRINDEEMWWFKIKDFKIESD